METTRMATRTLTLLVALVVALTFTLSGAAGAQATIPGGGDPGTPGGGTGENPTPGDGTGGTNPDPGGEPEEPPPPPPPKDGKHRFFHKGKAFLKHAVKSLFKFKHHRDKGDDCGAACQPF